MKKIIFYSFFCLMNITAQDDSSDFDISSFFYLEGKWVIENEGNLIFEEWKIENDTLLTSLSYYVKNGDTTNTETVRLVKAGNNIFYIPNVEHNPAPVKFKLISLEDNRAVFENPEHDFPTKIIYQKISDDSLNASIEGITGGELKVINYPFKKVK